MPDARLLAAAALAEPDPRRKAQAARALYDGLRAGACAIEPARVVDLPDLPGRPVQPVLVAPRELSRRGVQTLEGRVAMLHAIAHIEFNAINLALDAIARFPAMPLDYYIDWARVAAEEGYHFTLLADHLARLGGGYGAHPAHDGLWDMAVRTRGDVLARMALVPRTLEARGLDAAPPIRAKLAQAGDTVAAGILDIILRDEITHVAIGNRWFRWLCRRAGHDPLAFYAVLARDYRAPRLKGPFNLPARRAAGFGEDELQALQRDAAMP
ncbi:MAG: ferritin-like domain-containing protein [Janthinobacterium lividum]